MINAASNSFVTKVREYAALEGSEVFVVCDNEKDARNFAETFIADSREKMLEETKGRMSLDDLFSQIQEGNLKELNIIVKADVQGSVEAVKTVSDLNMPATGEVLEFNEALNDQPELVNNDPYGEGWMIKISVNDVAELDNLLDAAAYEAML